MDEVAAAVKARSDLVPCSQLGVSQGQVDLLMVQVGHPRAGGQTAYRARGSEKTFIFHPFKISISKLKRLY